MSEGWVYFGCGRGSGHYTFSETGRSVPWELDRLLCRFDGKLPPQPELEKDLYRPVFSRLGGLRRSSIAWWDRSVDKRPGSNSVVFAPGLTIEAADMLAEAKRRFPWVFARCPAISFGEVTDV